MAGEERSVIVLGCGTGGNLSGRINQRLLGEVHKALVRGG